MTQSVNVALKPPSFLIDIAVGIIVQELGVYLGVRSDVSTIDIEQGYEALATGVVESCYAAIVVAERHLVLRGDLDAFERELRRYARMCAKAWADARASDLSRVARIELDAIINSALHGLEGTADETEMVTLATCMFNACGEIARRGAA